MDHPVIGPARFEGTRSTSPRWDRTTGARRPLLGEDNDYVFKQIVGVSEDEYDELQAEKVI